MRPNAKSRLLAACRRKHMVGISMIEVLIAIFIFSIGVLSLVGVQATSLKAVTDSRFRSSAALLANDLLSEARLANRALIKAEFDSAASNPVRYRAWYARMVSDNVLPGLAANPPEVVVSADNEMTVTVRWQTPTDPTVRKHVVMTQLSGMTTK